MGAMLPRYAQHVIDARQADIHREYRDIYSWWVSEAWRDELAASYTESLDTSRKMVLRAVSVPMIGHRSYRAWTALGAGTTYGEYIDANRIDIIDV